MIECCIILIHLASTQMQPRFYHSRFTDVFVISLQYQSTLRLPDIYSTFVGLINSNYQTFIFRFSYMYLLFLRIEYRIIRLQVHYHIKSTSSSKRSQLSDLKGAHYFAVEMQCLSFYLFTLVAVAKKMMFTQFIYVLFLLTFRRFFHDRSKLKLQVSNSLMFLYQEFLKKYITEICKQNILKIYKDNQGSVFIPLSNGQFNLTFLYFKCNISRTRICLQNF